MKIQFFYSIVKKMSISKITCLDYMFSYAYIKFAYTRMYKYIYTYIYIYALVWTLSDYIICAWNWNLNEF